MIGIICNDDINMVGHSLFNNYRLALYNHFGKDNIKDVLNINDLKNINKLIIVDEHFGPNVNIWQSPNFIQALNNLNINTIIFNFEKIFNSAFPWNLQHQNLVNSIKKCTQINADAEDIILLGKTHSTKQYLSKNTNFNVPINNNKINKILFIGQTEGQQYTHRRHIISLIKNTGLDIDVITTNRKLSYSEFLSQLNNYKYILNPLGTGQFINLRFFEALYFNTIPIQEINDNVLKYNPEISDFSVTFSVDNIKELPDKLLLFKSSENKLNLEQYFEDMKLKEM